MEREMLETVDEVEEVRGEIPEDDEREKVYALRRAEARGEGAGLEVQALSAREGAGGAGESDAGAPQEGHRRDGGDRPGGVHEKKVKSGIERLDDLLLGGMPFGSNVLYVGPPFIGKETAMLLFLARV